MKFEFVSEKEYRKKLILLSVLALLIGVGSAFLSQIGLLLVAPLAAVLAALYLVDKTPHRVLFIIISVITVAVEIVIDLYLSFNCLCAILLALIILYSIRENVSKSFCATLGTVLLAVVSVAYLLFGAFYTVGAFDLEPAAKYLTDVVGELREELTAALKSFAAQDPSGNIASVLDDKIIAETLDVYFSAIPSAFALMAFAIVGFAFKIFGAIARRLDTTFDLMHDGWVFGTPVIFAYFYLVLAFIQLFVGGTDVLSVAMLNLYVVFTAVYAYVGYRFACFLFTRAIKMPTLASFLVIISIIFFSQFAIQVLAYAGVFETVMIARMQAKNDADKNDQGG